MPRQSRDRQALGRRGERAAARFLRRSGYRLLGRNLRTPRGEVDLLTRHEGILVVIEVKTTTAAARGPRVSAGQRRRLAAAAAWLAGRKAFRTSLGAPCTFRVDFAFVTLDGRHFVVTIRRDALRRSG